jgi:hypothetical protein
MYCRLLLEGEDAGCEAEGDISAGLYTEIGMGATQPVTRAVLDLSDAGELGRVVVRDCEQALPDKTLEGLMAISERDRLR